MKAISTPILFVYLLMTLFISESAFAVSTTGSFQGSRSYKPTKYIIHTVQKNESLSKIIQKYGANFSQTIAINGIINPDLIIPGHKIKLQADGSILVMEKEEQVTGALPFNYTPKQIIAHVSLPNKDDPFAPENPSVSYEVKAPVLKPV